MPCQSYDYARVMEIPAKATLNEFQAELAWNPVALYSHVPNPPI